MTSSFLVKDLMIDVDTGSWGKKPVPAQLTGASGQLSFDVGEALHMLGTLTMPNLLSPASPALFWAWLRYYLAPASSLDLRITMDFADLDPHQKGILSDDLGVAISTKWLNDRYAGLKIVDGRSFILQFPQHLRNKKTSKAKVGPSKCPDFVMKDASGKWHILECKGTQTLRHQNSSLKAGVQQKHAIQLVGAVKGEQLTAALFIANEKSTSPTHLKVVDPEGDEPILRLTDNQADEMDANADRLALARALGMIGLGDLAIEISLPPDISADIDLLRPSEAARVRGSREERYRRAFDQARERPFTLMSDNGQRYAGREAVFEIPPTGGRIPFRNVVIRQGMDETLVSELTSTAMDASTVDKRIVPMRRDARVTTAADSTRTVVRYGDLLFSEMIWT